MTRDSLSGRRQARILRCLIGIALAGIAGASGQTYDVVVYGASSAGVIAAVQAARMHKSTVLISQTHHVGGMTASGLGTTDTGNAATIGGLALAFYNAVYEYYHGPLAADGGAAVNTAFSLLGRAPSGVQFDFEPHVAETVFLAMLRSAGADVVFDEQLDRENGVTKTSGVTGSESRIAAIRMKSGRFFSGRMFIDATYEGDLMAAAQVSYRVGREDRTDYHESLGGIYPDPQLTGEVDPYWTPGDPASGVLPGVSPVSPGPAGAADHRVQQYNLRLCVTNVRTNQIPFQRPPTYSRANYELLRRLLLLHPEMSLADVMKVQPLPGGKADVNANGSFSTDMAGDDSTQWPEASDEERVAILQRYRDYTEGLFWFLVNDPGVPLTIRKQAAAWGLAADEFNDTDHWPWQLYVREARRMVGSYVMTQHNCDGEATVPDPIALGSYGIDSHKVTLYIDASGELNTEGSMFHPVAPYPISYRAIIPQGAECENLLVPICVSATHVAYNSLRMEPVYMMLGHAAATAACLAIDREAPVQAVNYSALARQLRADGQILTWPTTPDPATDALTDEPDISLPRLHPPQPLPFRRPVLR